MSGVHTVIVPPLSTPRLSGGGWQFLPGVKEAHY